MKYNKFVLFALLIALVAFLLAACKKNDPEVTREPSPVFIRMTDAPGPYTAVNVDIQSVEVTSNGKSITLNTSPGIYNLLDFSNGLDTLIATGSVNAEKIQQIRLILGPINSVVSAGKTYSLATPSADQSGLKLQVHKTLEAGVAYSILLDFDANQSVVEEGNGSYKLKPVIRTIDSAISGAIKGVLSVAGVPANVTATSGENSYSTIVNANGEFILKGLPAGTYTLTVTPSGNYTPATLNNLSVTIGNTTITGTINV